MPLQIIDRDQLKQAEKLPKPYVPPNAMELAHRQMANEEEVAKVVQALNAPLELQKELAAKVKFYLDAKIRLEMSELQGITNNTKSWMRFYNEMLTDINKAINGDRHVNLNVNAITHADISALMRGTEQ